MTLGWLHGHVSTPWGTFPSNRCVCSVHSLQGPGCLWSVSRANLEPHTGGKRHGGTNTERDPISKSHGDSARAPQSSTVLGNCVFSFEAPAELAFHRVVGGWVTESVPVPFPFSFVTAEGTGSGSPREGSAPGSHWPRRRCRKPGPPGLTVAPPCALGAAFRMRARGLASLG